MEMTDRLDESWNADWTDFADPAATSTFTNVRLRLLAAARQRARPLVESEPGQKLTN